MNEYAIAFLELVKYAAAPALAWAFGTKAFKFIVDALTGRDARL